MTQVARGGRWGVLLIVVALTAACASQPVAVRRQAPFTRYLLQEAALTPEQADWLDDSCPAGAPLLDPAFDHGPTALVAREGYALEHSCQDLVPLWVCERITPEELTGEAKRRDKFKPDPELEETCRAELADYKRSGFDRGHQAPADNQRAVQTLKDETFFLSNMAPQVGPRFNQQIWRELEDMANDPVEQGEAGSVFVVTGGFFYDPEEEDPATADGLITVQRIGDARVAVPTHFYKIVAIEPPDGTEEDWRVVGFVMENRKHQSPYDFAEFIKPVRWIEQRTGIDFMPDLGPLLGPELEEEPGEPFWTDEPQEP